MSGQNPVGNKSTIGLPHHCGKLQKRIATQLIHSELKIIEPSMDLGLHFL
jgi:hypothetical protein